MKSADQSLRIPVNHEEREASSGAIIELEAGSRVTLVPGLYHEFYPVSDECIAPYPLAQGCQDHLIGLAIDESAATGALMVTGVEPWGL